MIGDDIEFVVTGHEGHAITVAVIYSAEKKTYQYVMQPTDMVSINTDTQVFFLGSDGLDAQLGFRAPRVVPVLRKELLERRQRRY